MKVKEKKEQNLMIRKPGETGDTRNMTPEIFLHKVTWNHFLTHPKVRKRRITPWNNKKQIKSVILYPPLHQESMQIL